MAKIYRRKRSPYFWVEFYDAYGKRVRLSTRCTDRKAALAAAGRLEREAHDPARYRAGGHKAAQTVTQALQHFINHGCHDLAERTAEGYAQKGSQVARIIGRVTLGELERDHVDAFVAQRLSEGAAKETVRKELVVLRRTLELARDRGAFGTLEGVIPRLRVRYRPRERWLTREEYARLIEVLGSEDRRFWLMVAVHTGANLSELRGLDWRDIGFRSGTIRIRGTKTNYRDRRVPIARDLWPELKKRRRRAGPVLPWWGNVDRDLKRAAERIGIAPLSPNDLRRTFASWLKQAGVDSSAVARLLGHGSTRMVEAVYGRLSQQTLEDAMAKVFGPPPRGKGGEGPGVDERAECAGSVPDSGTLLRRAETDETRPILIGWRKC